MYLRNVFGTWLESLSPRNYFIFITVDTKCLNTWEAACMLGSKEHGRSSLFELLS